MYLQLFWTFFKLGLFTIGGGLAMIPLMESIIVDKKGWLTKEEMIDCISISQGLPGVIAINMATYIGHKKKGVSGALVATLGVIIPSFVAIIAIIELLKGVENTTYVQGALKGIKMAVIVLIGLAAFGMGKRILKRPVNWILALGAFLALGIFNINVALLILGGALVGVVQVFLMDKGKEKNL